MNVAYLLCYYITRHVWLSRRKCLQWIVKKTGNFLTFNSLPIVRQCLFSYFSVVWMDVREVFISRRNCKTCENTGKGPKCMPSFPFSKAVYWDRSLLESLPGPIVVSGPYDWHPCYTDSTKFCCRVVWWIQTRPNLSSLDQARNLQVYYTQTWHELTQIPLQYFNVFQRHLSPVQSQMIQKKSHYNGR